MVNNIEPQGYAYDTGEQKHQYDGMTTEDSILWDLYRKRLISGEIIEQSVGLEIDTTQDRMTLKPGKRDVFLAFPASSPNEWLIIPNPRITFGRESLGGLFPDKPNSGGVYQPRLVKMDNGIFMVT